MRGALRRFTDDVGKLWTSLADYFIRLGHFEKARDTFEEGITTVVTVRDFSMIFDAYTQFEETMISAKMEEDDVEEVPDDLDVEGGDDMDLRLARLQVNPTLKPNTFSTTSQNIAPAFPRPQTPGPRRLNPKNLNPKS